MGEGRVELEAEGGRRRGEHEGMEIAQMGKGQKGRARNDIS